MLDDRNEYWWASDDLKAVIGRLDGSQDGRSMHRSASAFEMAWYRNTIAYYSTLLNADGWDTGLRFDGRQGELVFVTLPMMRSLIRQVVSIVTKQRLVFGVSSDTTAADRMETARIGTALCKSVVRTQNVDIKYEQMFEQSLVTGLSFLYVTWRSDKGEFWSKDLQNRPVFKGDVQVSAPSVWDVEFDASIHDPQDWEWVKVREIHNRWNLIAQFPELKELLVKIPAAMNSSDRFTVSMNDSPSKNDLIFVWCAYHRPSPALPDGRMIVYASDECVLLDDINYYGRLPIYVTRGEAVPQSSYGYPLVSSLLPAQEIFDTVMSAIATNNVAHAVQSIATPRNSNVTVESIMGMNFFTYSPTDGGGEPKPMQFTKSAPESFKLVEMLKGYLQELSMLNSALRGEPPAGVTSGTAIATLTTTSLESIAASSKAARACLREAMLGAIDCYRRMASIEREIAVEGASGDASTLTFSGPDLDPIKDITIEELNPARMTDVARQEEANFLLEKGLITDPKTYFQVKEGAPVSIMYKKELAEADLISRENEALMSGKPVYAMAGDDHPEHMAAHYALLNDPQVRGETPQAQAILAHVLKHYELVKMTDPILMGLLRTGRMPEGGLPPPGPELPVAAGGQPPAQGQGAQPKRIAQPAKPTPDPVGRSGGNDEVA